MAQVAMICFATILEFQCAFRGIQLGDLLVPVQEHMVRDGHEPLLHIDQPRELALL